MILELKESMIEAFSRFLDVFSKFGWTAVLDILLVAVLIYGLILQLRKTQSLQILKGFFLILIIFVLVRLFNLQASSYLFNQLFSNILLIGVIIFNTEIRQALETFGHNSFTKLPSIWTAPPGSDEITGEAIEAVCGAVMDMSEESIGSFIVFQRSTILDEVQKGSVGIDAVTTREMLGSIFFPNSNLHDGAVIISEGRIVAARCVVPLKNDRGTSESYGTRHRAAIEVTRSSDAAAVVTSEETGTVSFAYEGILTRGISEEELRERLNDLLINKKDDGEKPKNRGEKFTGMFKGGKKNG